MLNRVSNAILDTIAPSVPILEEFRWQWQHISDFYVSKSGKGCKSPVEETSLPTHLAAMVKILIQEDEDKYEDGGEHGDTLGPCLEFFFERNVLNTLTTLAETDVPPGMCRHIFEFMTDLISKSSTELLAHSSFYICVQKLTLICCKLIASPYEESEVAFLNSIAVRIRCNEDLLNCYIRDKFPLVISLTSLLLSADNNVSTRAGEALLCLFSVCKDNAAEVIVSETPFCMKIIDRLIELYVNIPKSLRPEEVESSMATAMHFDDKINISSFSTAIRKYLCFLRWFVFCDMLLHECKSKLLTETFIRHFKEEFLVKHIAVDICEQNLQTATLTTVLITNCLRNASSIQLTTDIAEFLCEHIVENRHVALKDELIERCKYFSQTAENSDSSESEDEDHILCISTMQLFEEMLNRPSEKVLNNLCIQYLSSRSYFNDCIQNSDEPECSSPLNSKLEESFVPPTTSTKLFSSQSRCFRTLQYFLRLVPDELKSSESETDTGYESYIAEAQKNFSHCVDVCQTWSWQKYNVNGEISSCSDDETSSESKPEADRFTSFCEGDLLSMLFDNLERMVDLPYDITLQVTSLLSKLALFPEKHLHEYLLDASIPLSKGSRSLFSVLHKLVDELQIGVQGVGNLQMKLRLTRNLLLGNSEDISVKSIDESNTKTLKALIVIEEFCKELAALVFVKFHFQT
ncbi:hypothetical protein B4U80_11063 [Leptotrombidium deliense]|uniref:FHF complex subunit HOOK-interacting protein C-terminal domain-containing protein n=1 Tax=Leptotrombidium deliense TaxID=299467 RepID=A0A443STF5_9ACAR|nr:hypothetical protein B4U80_11063 [Leptotrombidium deliense]